MPELFAVEEMQKHRAVFSGSSFSSQAGARLLLLSVVVVTCSSNVISPQSTPSIGMALLMPLSLTRSSATRTR